MIAEHVSRTPLQRCILDATDFPILMLDVERLGKMEENRAKEGSGRAGLQFLLFLVLTPTAGRQLGTPL